jgi:hypothetical protein
LTTRSFLSFFLSYPPKSRSLWAVLDDEFAAGLGHASHFSLEEEEEEFLFWLAVFWV